MRTRHDTQTLILGAGPAGLSLARELAVKGVDYLILEKSGTVGSTFVKMTESTTFGPWLNNTLPGKPVRWTQMLSRTTRADYARYLQEYATQHKLRISCDVRVSSTHADPGGFLVRTERGDSFGCEYLVNATGLFSKPNMPSYPGGASTLIPALHSSFYRSPQTVEKATGKKGGRVLIVGSRLSAGEILQELDEAGYEVHLSHRGPIETWPSRTEETLLSPFTYLWEEVSLRLGLGRPSNLRPRLRRGRQWSLLTSGKVRSHPDILKLEKDSVVFLDHAQERFDMILYATGYLPALDHLAPLLREFPPWVSELESMDVPNLFFLGLPGGRTFRSEFLRGIREDAPYLAELLVERIAPPLPRALPTRGEVVSMRPPGVIKDLAPSSKDGDGQR